MFKLIFLGFHQKTVEQLAGTKLTGQMDSAMCKSVLTLNVYTVTWKGYHTTLQTHVSSKYI